MKTICNPGSLLVVEGSFEIVPARHSGKIVLDREFVPDDDDHNSLAWIGHEVTLVRLLRSFLDDPAETLTGPIRITIESAPEYQVNLNEEAEAARRLLRNRPED